MESLAKDMVEKCRGLPLAIVVLSGLLSHKKGLDEWQKVKDHLWKNIIEDKYIEVSNILSLSYSDLSTALKQCFQYFGIFPEDKVVDAENIIWLSMDEGFIPRGEERMEDVAEGFLNELIRRSLIQVVDTVWEKFTECRVHDLLRDLAIQKALEILLRTTPETADLINLRHLDSLYSKPLKRLSKLTSLQVLKGVLCDQWKDVEPVDLVNLRELTMHDITKTCSLNNISSLKNLSTTRLFCEGYESFPSLEFLNCCEKLQKLWLKGRIEKLPLFPNSITMMFLRNSKLREDLMPILGMLPNLRNLILYGAYEGKEIMCNDNSFSQLKFLCLDQLSNLKIWHLGTNVMPLINDLHIKNC
uniref:EDNR2GH5 protein n=1 Tax=Solanum tuberosum TaxID=4113 RepID=M1CY34_SOLTU